MEKPPRFRQNGLKQPKVFCFFFSKKKFLLTSLEQRGSTHAHVGHHPRQTAGHVPPARNFTMNRGDVEEYERSFIFV
jgi:hypothetical protein